MAWCETVSHTCYDFTMASDDKILICDGCGQFATPDHIARRLQRLEWATRFRPVHIQTLLLSGVSPRHDREYLYSPGLLIDGEARNIFQAVQVSTEGKSRELFLTEFQKLGLMLAYVLECPLADDLSPERAKNVIEKQLPAVIARIRRSLKPKRVVLLSSWLEPFRDSLQQANLSCPVFPGDAGTFLPSVNPTDSEFQAFRAALAGVHA